MWISESGGGKNPKSVWWNDEVKDAARRKDVAWKEVLTSSDEEANERCMEVQRRKEVYELEKNESDRVNRDSLWYTLRERYLHVRKGAEKGSS